MALSDVKVGTAKPEAKAYKLTDSDGMVLLVHPYGSKYWRLRYRFDGKEKMLALGIDSEVTPEGVKHPHRGSKMWPLYPTYICNDDG